MNEKQTVAFNAAYKNLHDEGHDCMNIAALIKLHFPEDGSGLNEAMGALASYFETRAVAGRGFMETLYVIKEQEGL